ncbi:ATP-grasp domain-containing protein [Microbispora sp. H10670]|uniref:ATP-grasp domain-containing protein n=1 Tax=Microbispora sp. H10670 TaxID=2729108 RepID=UPI001601480D|nr:ATP-grasp domain-containing protein [Microbispora sp. H10670]
MPDRPHYLVVNRYDDSDAEYFRYCADQPCDLSYLTLPMRTTALGPVEPGRVGTVPDLRLATLVPAARDLAERYGRFDGVAALSEFDVLTAALLREEFGAPGPGADLVRAFKDKIVMKERLAKRGLPVPRFMELGASTTIAEITAGIGFPLVLKPRAEAGSVGVRIIRDEEELAAELDGLDVTAFECEEFVSTEIYHADGVLSGGLPHFLSVSGYVNTPLDFLRGRPLGSATLDPGPLRDEIREFAVACLRALGLETGCFHLEVIRRPDGGLVFLEAGMRAGGAEVPYVHRELHGIDLVTESFRTVLGIPLESAGARFGDAPAGWVVMPEPGLRPGRVVRRTAMTGTVPQVYAEVLPEPGDVFDGTGGYFHVPGRFRLTGPDERSVRAAARRVMREYAVEFESAGHTP